MKAGQVKKIPLLTLVLNWISHIVSSDSQQRATLGQFCYVTTVTCTRHNIHIRYENVFFSEHSKCPIH